MGKKGEQPTVAQQIAAFVTRARFEDLSSTALQHLKLHILDTLGCAIGATGYEVPEKVRAYLRKFPDRGRCTLIGGGHASPDRAALMNSALVRYLDFMDNFLADGETCHPCDNFGAVLAASEHSKASGVEFMTALAVAYEVQCRFTKAAPIMRSGFDHTTQQAFSVAAGVSKALRLDTWHTANAIAIGGVDAISLAVNRASPVSQWKGLASADEAARSTQNVFLAAHGITGPGHVFEGPGGFSEALSKKFSVDWNDGKLGVLPHTVLKRFNAEVHTQSALEGLLELRRDCAIHPKNIRRITIDIFKTAYEIVGGGKFGDKYHVAAKEHADHSLPYLAAVLLLDGDVWPEQFAPERIAREDVQQLLRKVVVRPRRLYTLEYPRKMDCYIVVELSNGRRLTREKEDFEGFPTRPFSWDRVVEKFKRLTSSRLTPVRQAKICETVATLENKTVGDLTRLLGNAREPARQRHAVI